MISLNFVLLLLLLVTYSTAVETSSRWTSVMPMNVTNHRNVSARGRDFRFDTNSFIYETSSVYDVDSTEEYSGNNPNGFLKENATVDSVSLIKLRRFRRSEKKWIESYTTASADVIRMHAFIVKDEEIPDCGTAAQHLTKTRYYVCSGTVLTYRHILTSATCMNMAVFYQYQIHAEVAALVGDLGHESYVIKVLDYTMHPKYDPNPASSVHELNNLAVMSLSCPIPDGKIVLPNLPSQKFDDLAHVCCTDKCSISSVFRLAHNRYILQSMLAKHIPTFDKVHGNDFTIIKKLDTNDNEGSINAHLSLVRSTRDNQKSFISQFYIKKMVDQIKKNKSLEIKNSTLTLDEVATQSAIKRKRRANRLLMRPERDTSKDNADTQRIMDLPSQWTQVVQEINAGTVSEKSQDEMRTFLKIAMTGVLEKIVKVLSTHVGDVANAYPYFLEAVNSENVTKTVEQSLMSYLTKTVEKGDFYQDEPRDNGNIPNGSNDKSDIGQKSPDRTQLDDTAMRSLDIPADQNKEKMEFFCPSIGTPIIQENTVIGLIVYTCDEVQNWVAWKYVETVHNTEWIRKQMQVVYYEKVDE